MTIVRMLGNKKFLTLCIATAFTIIATQSAFTPQKNKIFSDSRWAVVTRTLLKKELEHFPIRSHGAQGLHTMFEKEYPCVKAITIAYRSNLEASVTLIGYRPHLILRSIQPGTKEYILCEKGQILERTDFTAEALEGIPTLLIAGDSFEEKRKSNELIDMAMRLSSTLFDKYTITWHSKTDIILRSSEKNITIVSDISSIHDEARYNYIERIFSSEERYHRGMKADIRPKDSLVCAPLT